MFSIVIASHLKGNFIKERINCIDRCINTYRDYVEKDYNIEIILIFDKTEDSVVPESIKKRVDKIYFHDKGLGSSFNLGIENAKYDIIVQTEDDWAFDDGYIDLCYDRFKTAFYIIENYDKHAFVRMDAIPELNWKLGYKKIISGNNEFYIYNRPKSNTTFTDVDNFYYYSNRPQMKIKNFHKIYNIPYKENCSVPEVEIDMCYKFIKNRDIKVYSNERAYDHTGGGISVREQ
jgi:hypothetical protein